MKKSSSTQFLLSAISIAAVDMGESPWAVRWLLASKTFMFKIS